MTPTDLLTFDGMTQPVSEWALDYGIPAELIIERLNEGQSVEAAITTMMPFDADPKPARAKRGTVCLTHNGETLSVPEWSKRTGVPIATIRQRAKRGLPLADVLNPDLNKKNALYTHNGETHTLAEWATITGINYATLRHRVVDNGLSLGEAITVAKHSKGSYRHDMHTHNGEVKTLAEWATHAGISHRTLHNRLTKNGMTLGDALALPKNAKPSLRGPREAKAVRTVINIVIAGVRIDIDATGPGVVFNFADAGETGARGSAQEIPEITFSEKATTE